MMARKGSSLRLFVGVYPPPEVAAALLASLKALDLPAHRRTPAEQVHLTLQFIGDTAVRDLEDVTESVRRAASASRKRVATPPMRRWPCSCPFTYSSGVM